MSEAEHIIVPVPSSQTTQDGNGSNQATASPSSTRVLDWIAEQVTTNQCILFLGSAIHVPSPSTSKYYYPKEKCPPVGDKLSEILKDQCGYKGEDWRNLQRVSQYFETDSKSRFLLVNAIRNAVQVNKEASPVLHALANLDFPIVITTNYDDLYEKALNAESAKRQAAGQPAIDYDVCVYSPNYRSRVKTPDCSDTPDPAKPFILKVHGDISKPESIVITEEDYIQFVLRMSDKQPHHPVGKNVLAYLNKWPTLFIGYRLTDYNLRLLFKTLRWKMDAAYIPPTYSVDINPDILIRDVYENQRRYVTFIVEDLWDFVPSLYKAVKGKEMPQ
jgi:hypothetical protein